MRILHHHYDYNSSSEPSHARFKLTSVTGARWFTRRHRSHFYWARRGSLEEAVIFSDYISVLVTDPLVVDVHCVLMFLSFSQSESMSYSACRFSTPSIASSTSGSRIELLMNLVDVVGYS